ncbi:anthranilate synthase component II [Candidatus Chloroploca asiatica]|uniref:Anthranilate synthase component 2 n=1 Tax=Candidatus Chloroploca asiatica TaxID=1506545 RepID=A0A2H3KN93_9CHLR|nr:aminodeoxychorismate/anthranilate synthase component II [Candidatus Chloroploca asiatica]PDV99567.1 anthranilate synthase component 2 [Candidatus Chloroploca asiatica]
MRVLLLDNYDSFTYNLYQYLSELGATVDVRRNDAITVAAAAALQPDRIVVSPGPCTPTEAGISIALIQELGPHIPTLGVCLGHQALGAAFGGAVIRAPQVMHGKRSTIYHEGEGVFAGMPQPFQATRYHSLIVRRDDLPDTLTMTAWTEDGLIMGLRHRTYPIEGVQFHPESILTDDGKRMLQNFLTG